MFALRRNAERAHALELVLLGYLAMKDVESREESFVEEDTRVMLTPL